MISKHAARYALIGLFPLAVAGQTFAQGDASHEKPASYTVISPIFGQLVRFAMPTTFVSAFEKASADSYIREAVPRGETVENWSHMITVTGTKGLAASNPELAPQTVAGSIAGGFQRACPKTFASTALGATRYGNHDAFVAVVGCGRLENTADKHGETTLIVVLKGSADYYAIQWAERAPTSNAKPDIDAQTWTARLRLLSPIRACPILPGEDAPYPSCVNAN